MNTMVQHFALNCRGYKVISLLLVGMTCLALIPVTTLAQCDSNMQRIISDTTLRIIMGSDTIGSGRMLSSPPVSCRRTPDCRFELHNGVHHGNTSSLEQGNKACDPGRSTTLTNRADEPQAWHSGQSNTRLEEEAPVAG